MLIKTIVQFIIQIKELIFVDVAKKIRIMLVEENLKIIDLADRLNTSQQNISAKLKRNNFSVKEMEQIAEVLGYNLEITFTKKE